MSTHVDSKNSLYLLNAAIMTGFGDWRFQGPLLVEQARQLVAHGFTSAIGHAATAQFLSKLLSVEVPVNRIAVQLNPGDQALVLRLKGRLSEGVVYSEKEMQLIDFELGLLTRLS